jgi:hypothetical protein
MGVYNELVDFDALFFKAGTRTPFIVNDVKETTEADKNNLNKLIYTTYATDLLSNLPTCECGEGLGIVGEHNIGVFCPNCGTTCKAQAEQALESIVWMRSPKGVLGFINPVVWLMLTKKFTKSGFDIVRYLSDTNYKTHVQMPAIAKTIESTLTTQGIGRGYNNFINNFDAIIGTLFSLKIFKPKKRKGFKQVAEVIDPLQMLLIQNRNCIFSKYLPLPNRSLLVIEETNTATYADNIVKDAVNAILTMVNIDSDISNYSVRNKENRTIKAISLLAVFYDGLYKTTLAKKEGIFRKHIYGTRSHWSFRAVISSLTAAHEYDELHIPWSIALSVFRIHLFNKLDQHGFTPNEAKRIINEHCYKYSEFLDSLLSELISESPYKGVPCVLQRNPSLERGSAQAMFITQIKKDPLIPTVSLSILSVNGFNADFDGKVTTLPSLNFLN